MTVLTALDIGFSSTKVAATNGRGAPFASVVGVPSQGSGFGGLADKATTMGKPNIFRIELNGQVYQVGGEADYTTSRRDPGWVTSPTWEVLFCAALSELHLGTVSTSVVTGLPLSDWRRLNEPMRQRVLGPHTFRRDDGNWQTVTVEDAIVVTQPFGSLLNEAMSDGGAILNNPFATGTAAVCDIGGLTLNLLVADALEEVGRWTAGDGLGLLKAMSSIARDVGRDFPSIDPKAHEVDGWLKSGFFKVGDKQHDVKPYADKRFAPLVEAILNRLSETWPEPGRFDAVLLSGGGAAALGPTLKARMTDYPNVTIARDAQAANVRGYLKLARDIWR